MERTLTLDSFINSLLLLVKPGISKIFSFK